MKTAHLLGGALLIVAPLHQTLLCAAPPPEQLSFLENNCLSCHDKDTQKGGLDIESLSFDGSEATHAKWVRIYDRITNGDMPPPKKPRPDPVEQKAFMTRLDAGLVQQHAAMKDTVLRRLNRSEYENTLSDLLGMRLEVRDMLPEDSLSHGFDNIGEALAISDVQLQRYMEAAEFALNTALQRSTPPEAKKTTHTYQAGVEKAKTWLLRDDGAVVIFNNGGFPDSTLRSVRAPMDGKYRISVTAYGYQAQKPVVFALYSGRFGQGTSTDFLGYHAVPPNETKTITVDAWLRAGETVKFAPELNVNNPQMQKLGAAAYPGSGLAIKSVDIEGPIFEQWPPRGVTLLFGDLAKNAKDPDARKQRNARNKEIIEVTSPTPDADAARLLIGFTSAAFRRPVSEAKVAPYVALFQNEMKNGASFSVAMRTAATAILCAPDFLYFDERAADKNGRLSDYALASRLSYFLTRSAPDDELLRLAAAGKLRDATTLRAQTERLLNSPHLERFITDFTDGWLNLRDINFTTPDKRLYPEFDESLQHAMLGESRAFFAEMLRSNLGPTNIVASDFAILNERLADHYGIEGVEGLELRKVALPPDSKRGGVLTQAAVLKVSANGTNTSPVMRGTWLLERILGVHPSPPPPGVPGLEPDIRGATTLREQLDKHRNMESCNSCHKVIDPPGFALESYDVIGGWRERYRSLEKGEQVSRKVGNRQVRFRLGLPVDSSGQLTDGAAFKDFSGFQKLLLGKPESVTKGITEKLLTFAAGRELGYSDRAEVARIVNELHAKKGGTRDLVHLVVGSSIFQTE